MAMAIAAGVAAGVATWYFMSTENGKHNWAVLIDIAKDVSDKLIAAANEQENYLSSMGRDASEYIKDKSADTIDSIKSYS